MNLLLALLSGAFALMPAPAHADPIITPIVTAIFAAASIPTAVTIAGMTFSTVAIATALITTAIGLALAYAFAPKPKPPVPENGSFPFQQAIPPRIYAYGRCRIGGATMLLEASDSFLFHITALTGHRISAFNQFYLNDDPVTIAADSTVAAGSDGRYESGSVKLTGRLGNVPETAFSCPGLEGIWTANHRGDGCATMWMSCDAGSGRDFSKRFPYQRPQPSAVIDAALVYDWRDPSQNLANPSTWSFSRNPALMLAHFLCFNEFGAKMDFNAAISPVIDLWTEAADICDELVPLKAGGTERRYRAGGWTTTEQDNRSTVQTLLNCCDGHFVLRGDGAAILRAGKYKSPEVTLTDDDIAGFVLQSDVTSEDKINFASATYTFPSASYSTVETDPVINTADQALRPGPPRSARLELPWVQSTGQASRLLRREVFRQNQPLRGKLYLRISALNSVYERNIKISSNALPARLRNAEIENRKANINLAEQVIEIDFIGYGPQIDSYSAASDESTPPTAPDRPVSAGLPRPANVAAVAEQTTDSSGAASIYLNISWDRPTSGGVPRTDLTYRIRWRVAGIGGGQAGAWSEQDVSSPTISANRLSATTSTIASSTTFEVQVASIGSRGSYSDFSDAVSVSTTPTGTAPTAPSIFTATGGAGSVVLSAVNPSTANFAAVQFYRAVSGGTFVSAAPVGGPIYGLPGGTSTRTDNVAPGAWSYWVVALNAYSVASSPTGPQNATAT